MKVAPLVQPIRDGEASIFMTATGGQMANRRGLWVGITLGLVSLTVLVGAGAYAFGPARAAASQSERPASPPGKTGESASPGPTRSAAPAPSSPAATTESTAPTAPTSQPAPSKPSPSKPAQSKPAPSTDCPQGE